MSERTSNPERIYLEPPPYSPEGRQWCEDNVWPLDGDGSGGVEYVRADLATPESGGEGEERYWCGCVRRASWRRCDQHGALEHDEEPPARRPTPAASEDVRNQWDLVGEALNDAKASIESLDADAFGRDPEEGWPYRDELLMKLRHGIEAEPSSARKERVMTRSSQTEYERVAGVLEACADAEKRLGGHPYRAKIMRRSAELLRRAAALLRTPRGEGEAAVWALTTDSHEAKTFVLQHVLRFWSPELQASLSAALRSEAQGEGGDFNPLTDPLPEHEAERVERVLSRAARRGEGGRHV